MADSDLVCCSNSQRTARFNSPRFSNRASQHPTQQQQTTHSPSYTTPSRSIIPPLLSIAPALNHGRSTSESTKQPWVELIIRRTIGCPSTSKRSNWCRTRYVGNTGLFLSDTTIGSSTITRS
ncbi:hypothetical protein PGTUg99_035782 [Puccinia graminis f. sp. tritici]|uniref:Uncharacterized protein n=1 Tax=Puccinia graminis f. sp. tritici TaxID=56615 RepID=A0A5B0PQ59_PUCGR|nr:hypothetical protein PGTUg99_035782 [Puccinia graminis f. sp. tritici]